MKKTNKNLSYMIATCFGLGKISQMPGTLGSIVAFPLWFILLIISVFARGGMSSPVSKEMTTYMLFVTFIFFLIGIWASNNHSVATNQEDPGEIIIDEIVGQLLTIILILTFSQFVGSEAISVMKKVHLESKHLVFIALFSAFLLFRIFDIYKPWPIDYIDQKVKGGLGIMLDDIFASIMAAFSFFVIFYVVVDIIKLIT